MRVLIIGCGYVGLPLGQRLANEGHEVFGLRRQPGAEQELLAADIEPLFADITDHAQLARLPARYDWVVNCVAASGGGVPQYRAVYLEGTRNLLEWLLPAKPKKFVYTSSTSVYGQHDGSTVSEDSPILPGSETAGILRQTETVLLSAVREQNFPGVVLRVAGIYGPGRGYWLKQYLSGQARITGHGERLLNMVHRDDVVGAIYAALAKGEPGQIYNVVDDEPVTQLGLYQWLAGALGKGMPPSVPSDEAEERKRGLTSKRVSNRKLKTGLGYRLKHATFREGYAAEIARLLSKGEP